MPKKSSFFKRVFRRGLAAVLPAACTLWLLWWLISSTEALLGKLLPATWYRPGMGVALGILFVFAIGFLLELVLLRRIYASAESHFDRLPLVKMVYSPLKDLVNFFVARRAEAASNKVVRVSIGNTGLSLIGLVTRQSAADVTEHKDDADKVAVYLPMSYQIGGYMVLVPRSAVTELDMSLEHVLRLTVTAGMSSFDAELDAGEPPAGRRRKASTKNRP